MYSEATDLVYMTNLQCPHIYVTRSSFTGYDGNCAQNPPKPLALAGEPCAETAIEEVAWQDFPEMEAFSRLRVTEV